MSYQTPARNHAKESGNQRANCGQCVFRMICYCRSTPGSKTCGTGILVSALVLNFAGIKFPMTLRQIKKFETLNDISINLYIYTTISISLKRGLCRRFADQKRTKHVNLLYMENDNARHFALIKDLSRLVKSQITNNKNRKY